MAFRKLLLTGLIVTTLCNYSLGQNHWLAPDRYYLGLQLGGQKIAEEQFLSANQDDPDTSFYWAIGVALGARYDIELGRGFSGNLELGYQFLNYRTKHEQTVTEAMYTLGLTHQNSTPEHTDTLQLRNFVAKNHYVTLAFSIEKNLRGDSYAEEVGIFVKPKVYVLVGNRADVKYRWFTEGVGFPGFPSGQVTKRAKSSLEEQQLRAQFEVVQERVTASIDFGFFVDLKHRNIMMQLGFRKFLGDLMSWNNYNPGLLFMHFAFPLGNK